MNDDNWGDNCVNPSNFKIDYDGKISFKIQILGSDLNIETENSFVNFHDVLLNGTQYATQDSQYRISFSRNDNRHEVTILKSDNILDIVDLNMQQFNLLIRNGKDSITPPNSRSNSPNIR